MIAPEGQRQGLGQRLFTEWDENVGASMIIGSPGSTKALNASESAAPDPLAMKMFSGVTARFS